MDNRRNKVAVFNIASTIVLQGLTFFTFFVFSHLLGTSNYGIASVYLTWVQLASTIFSLQAGVSIANAMIKFKKEEQPGFQSSVLCLSTIAYILFTVFTVAGAFLISSWVSISVPMVIVGLAHGWGLYVVSFINSKFTYEFKADKNFILSVTVAVLTVGLSIILIRMLPVETNYWGRLVGQSAVYLIIGLILFVFILKSGKVVYDKIYWHFALPIAIPTIFHLLAGIVLNQSDRIMIQWFIDDSAAGIYSLSCTFGAVLSSIWNALNNTWVPFYYEYTKLKQTDNIQKHARNYMELYTVLTMGFILLAREVFHLVFLYSFAVNYEFYHKKTKTIALGTILAAICNIVLNYLFIMKMGILGAVIATAIAHGLQFVFHYICAKCINPGEFPFKIVQFIPGLLCVCLTSVLYFFTRDLWIIRWLLGVVLGVYLLLKIFKRKEIF